MSAAATLPAHNFHLPALVNGDNCHAKARFPRPHHRRKGPAPRRASCWATAIAPTCRRARSSARIFMTSTFVSPSAEGKAFLRTGLRAAQKQPRRRDRTEIFPATSTTRPGNSGGSADDFGMAPKPPPSSPTGMAAISTTLLQFLRPGDVVLHSEPVYGGTDYLLKHILPQFHVRPVGRPGRPRHGAPRGRAPRPRYRRQHGSRCPGDAGQPRQCVSGHRRLR